MDVFQWDKKFETGLTEVDKQHRHLVDVTNTFGFLLSHDDVNQEKLEEVFSELVSYTQYHFEEEEKLMQQAVLDSRHLKEHEQEHQGFLQEVALLHQDLPAAKEETKQHLFQFLMNWLIYHILGSDRSMARQINAVEKGASVTQAYEAETNQADTATALLLKSLNNLFRQVSSRNKQLMELNQTLETKVEERTRELSKANEQLSELALTDVLTELPNRRYAMQILDWLWEVAEDEDLPLACIMIDADGFKAINDGYGHDAGDMVLYELAKNLKYAVRTDDIVCRLGGDEFLIICPSTDMDGALHIANLVRAEIAKLKVQVNGGTWPGSISVGVAARAETMTSLADLLKAADLGVYAAKQAGKNCVRMASQFQARCKS